MCKNRWSEEDKRIIKENYGKRTYGEIQKMLSVFRTLKSIHRKAEYLKITTDRTAMYLLSRKYFRTAVNEDFFATPNELNSYWAGFLAADGNVYCKDGAMALQMQLSQKDLKHMKKFVFDVEFAGKCLCYTRKNNYQMCSVRILSEKIVKDLETNFSITPRKSLTLQPPNLVEKRLIDCFIIGYIDGDGCIRRYNKYNDNVDKDYFSLSLRGSEPFLEWVRYRLNEIIDKKHKSILANKIYKSKETKICTFAVDGRYHSKIILEHFNAYNVPKLYRKWSKLDNDLVKQ